MKTLFSSILSRLVCYYIRSSERRVGDVEVIAAYLHKWRCLDSLSNSLLRRLASAAYLEDLDDGVTRNPIQILLGDIQFE